MSNKPILPAVGTPISGDNDNAGNFIQDVFLNMGTPGSAPTRVCESNPLPMVLASAPTGLATSDGQASIEATLVSILAALGAALTISGTVSQSSQPLPTGAATQVTLAQILTALGTTLHVQDTSSESALSSIATLLSNPLAVTGTFFPSTQPVSAAALPLPSGAATQTTLAAVLSALASGILVTDTTAEARLQSIITALTGTLAISAVSLPLASGASTSALQTTGNTSLASIAAALAAALTISLPTGAATSALQTAMQTTLSSILTALTPTRTFMTAAFSISATGQIVAAVTGKRIKVFAYSLNSSLATLSVAFNSGGTAMTGAQTYLVGGGPFIAVDPPAFLFGTAAGSNLGLTITGIGTVNGFVSYWADDAS